eukprot:gnl/TRDRNA2_/TRDRNA2_115113_c2_seq1.p1 gnl/TRDRNA2_/TRDRNA2_115113_c2~~gnl/TRDRNA2_/TRDRNA2_115113_c2_seq1.p1  ORF type:complete len:138 (-),score=15.27 gnl/TRDRNA2_/TRDRNA2_115113_c2_seq1:11-424(-)
MVCLAGIVCAVLIRASHHNAPTVKALAGFFVMLTHAPRMAIFWLGWGGCAFRPLFQEHLCKASVRICWQAFLAEILIAATLLPALEISKTLADAALSEGLFALVARLCQNRTANVSGPAGFSGSSIEMLTVQPRRSI